MPTLFAAASGLSRGQIGFMVVVLLVMAYKARAVLIPAVVWLLVVFVPVNVLMLIGFELMSRGTDVTLPIGVSACAIGMLAFAWRHYRSDSSDDDWD